MTPTDDPAFSTRVRVMPNAPMQRFIKTVGEAIDAVNGLPDATQARPHWLRARANLYDASDPPHDANKVKSAEADFRDALKKERWLN